jgi:hypothetical protein
MVFNRGEMVMRQDIKRQRGMTGLGWLTVLFLIGFFALLTFKLAPIYLEHHSVKSVLNSLKDEPLITQRSKGEVLKIIMKRLNINSIRDLKRDQVHIDKSGGVLTVSIAYSVRKNMLGNVDVIVSFDDSVEMVSN